MSKRWTVGKENMCALAFAGGNLRVDFGIFALPGLILSVFLQLTGDSWIDAQQLSCTKSHDKPVFIMKYHEISPTVAHSRPLVLGAMSALSPLKRSDTEVTPK